MTSSEAMALGTQHEQAGRLAPAEGLFQQVLAAEPHNQNARYHLAVVCQRLGRFAEAIALYQPLRQPAGPNTAKVENNLGLAHAALGQRAEALACYQQAIRLKPDFAEAFSNLGNLYAALGDWAKAQQAYEQALALKPVYPAAWNNLARVFQQRQQWSEAVRCFMRVVEQQPESNAAMNQLGNALLNQGRIAEAQACFDDVLMRERDNAEANYNLARISIAQGRWMQAVLFLQVTLTINPKSALASSMLGDLYYCKLGRYDAALRCFQQVLRLAPDNAKARLLVGALSGQTLVPEVPHDYVTAIYDPLAEQFDQYVKQRGDCSPGLLKAALGPPPATPALTVLDLGCGTGLCGLQFRDWAQTLIGVDLSASMLAKARTRGIYDELLHGDLLKPFAAAKTGFDLILASDVLLYVGDLAPLFRAVKDGLRPGGRFAFTVDVFDGKDYRMTPWVHFAHSRSYLQRLAGEVQLREVYVQSVTFPRDNAHEAYGLVVVLAR